MTADISRHGLRPAQQFTGVVRQQGRLPIDSDETESDDIAAFLLRQTVTETICTRGTPDDGFTIGSPVLAAGALDFSIAAGSFYLAGARLASGGGLWSKQPDWIGISAADRAFALPAAGKTRTDLVYLHGWETTVTATEDAELVEMALGGPDTTARRRIMWRVELLKDVPDDCPDAFAKLVTQKFPGGTLDAEECGILSNARLTIGFTQRTPLKDLCRPNAQAGFLGARNETFRIQVTTPGRFVWGRDNAAPLYRVQVGTDSNGKRRKLHFLRPPRDEFGWPLAGMTVELLRWGSLLANHEKAAEPTGVLLKVANGFDPGDNNSIRVDTDIDAALDAWFATPAGLAAKQPLDAAGDAAFFFLRVWTGGGTAGAVDNPMQPGTVLALGDTGLTTNFSTGGMAGDAWIVSARPNTPTQVTPWALLTGAPPVSPRHVIAPLALLTSDPTGIKMLEDCRHTFRPLCEVGACCRVTVGDGRISFGDVQSIQAAIDRLPAEGGEICIHPGNYAEHVRIIDRKNIVIIGCGRTTRWTNAPGRVEPLVTIEGCSAITLRRIAMTNLLAEAVFAAGIGNAKPNTAITTEDLAINAADRPAIFVHQGGTHTVRRCRIALEALSASLSEDPDIGRSAAVFLSGKDLLIEGNQIVLAKSDGPRSRTPAGGIHIGSRSVGVMIRDNLIRGGNGHGISLGTAQFVPKDDKAVVGLNYPKHYTEVVRKNYMHTAGYGNGAHEYFGNGMAMSANDCVTADGKPPRGKPPGTTPVETESGGPVRDIRIRANDILDMGFNGISSQFFSGLGHDGAGDAIAVEHIEITENRIMECMRGEIGTMDALTRLLTGWGGVALSVATDVIIRANRIDLNGRQSLEPICGIFIAIGETIVVTDNIITANGIRMMGDGTVKPGARGGIILGFVRGGIPSTAAEVGNSDWGQSDRPALTVSGNSVDAPTGRALQAVLIGPAIVHGNRLTGAGRSALAALFSGASNGIFSGMKAADGSFQKREAIDLRDLANIELFADLMGGDVVSLINLGVAEDVASLVPGSPTDASTLDRLRGGEMLVNDNQISMRRHSRAMLFTLSAVLVMSGDDIGFGNNQVEVENDVVFIMNTLALAVTVRVTGNRFQEGILNGLLSLVSSGFLNTTSLNQATRCILAAGVPGGLVKYPNTVLLSLAVPNLCSPFSTTGLKMSDAVGASAGYSSAAPGE